ncbi:MAG TPA: MBL fold metallo-hydrolase [Dehalococcoidia bacterium]|jgi:glyoxylase-like metal-dependent hydrolase (beta-lactamase superfamily II)|nr:MBL fold metallo-hydrolase [Dehalococcoidia bacterium]
MPLDVIKIGPLGPYANNVYIIVDRTSKQSLFVDAPFESAKALDAAKDTDVQRIVVTHRHGDHWANIDDVKAATRAPVYCHEGDREPYAAKVEGTLADGDEIAVGDARVRVLHTPGHTPGSICLFFETADGPALISGDTLFPGGPGRSDNPDALRQMVASIKSRLLPLPENTHVYPGHGDDTTIGVSREEVAVFDARPHPADLHGDVTWSA